MAQPDIMAPGQSILAAIVPKTSEAIGNKAPEFTFRSGTSMACPHVSGTAAFVKSVHPRWTSSMIKSALMTTGMHLFSINFYRVIILQALRLLI